MVISFDDRIENFLIQLRRYALIANIRFLGFVGWFCSCERSRS